MSVFVLEIAGQAILAMAAQTRLEAEAKTRESCFEADLLCLENGFAPLWDGLAELKVRAPSTVEQALFESAGLKQDMSKSVAPVFLIPATDPTTDDLDG